MLLNFTVIAIFDICSNNIYGVLLAEDNFDEIRKKMLSEVKNEIKSGYSSEEYTLIQAVNAYDEVLRSYNLFSERLTEWYLLYYPNIRVQSPNLLADLIKVINNKDELTLEKIDSVVNDINKSKSIYEKATVQNIGKEISPEEAYIVERYSELIKKTSETLEELQKYIDTTANKLMPNTVYLTNSLIASGLLNKAGSMEKLSIMPSSTIQLLGAENALFKHIKFGSKPPKYGLLFKLPEINTARRDIKGRIARVYANKISIALKADYYTKNFIAKELKESLESSISRISKSPVKIKSSATINKNYNSKKHGLDKKGGHRQDFHGNNSKDSFRNNNRFRRKNRKDHFTGNTDKRPNFHK